MLDDVGVQQVVHILAHADVDSSLTSGVGTHGRSRRQVFDQGPVGDESRRGLWVDHGVHFCGQLEVLEKFVDHQCSVVIPGLLREGVLELDVFEQVGRQASGVCHFDFPEGKQGSNKRRSCTLGQSPCAVCADALCTQLRLPAPLELVLVASVLGGASPTSPGEPWGLFLERNGPYKGVLPVMRAFSSEPLRMRNGTVVLTPVVTDAHNLNRELFKGRRSLEPVGSRTITVGRVEFLVG